MAGRILVAVFALFICYSEVQSLSILEPTAGILPWPPVPPSPPSLTDRFTNEFLRGIRLYNSIDNIFNTTYNPSNAYYIIFNIIYSKGVKHGVSYERSLVGAKSIGETIKDCEPYLTPEKLAVAHGHYITELLQLGGVINDGNVISLAQDCCKSFINAFSKKLPNTISGLSDGAEHFLNPLNLYAPDAFEIKNAAISKHMYIAAGLR